MKDQTSVQDMLWFTRSDANDLWSECAVPHDAARLEVQNPSPATVLTTQLALEDWNERVKVQQIRSLAWVTHWVKRIFQKYTDKQLKDQSEKHFVSDRRIEPMDQQIRSQRVHSEKQKVQVLASWVCYYWYIMQWTSAKLVAL